MLSFSVVLPLLPYLGKAFGATTIQLGLLTACYPIAQTIAAPLLGRLSDRIGRKPVLIFSIIGTVAGFIILALSQYPAIIALGDSIAASLGLSVNVIFFVLIVSRLVDGITGGNISVAQAYIADITTREERSRSLGLIGAAFGIGFIIGPVTGGLLYGISPAAPAWLGAALAAINACLVAILLPESLTKETRLRIMGNRVKIFSRETLRRLFAHPAIAPLLSIRVTTGLAFAMFESGFALWALTTLNLSAQQNSFFLAYIGVLTVIIQGVIMRPLTKKFTDNQLLVSAIALTIISFILWGAVTTSLELWLMVPIFSLGLSVTNTVLTSAFTKSVTADEVGGILGVQASLMSVTRAVGPLLAAFLLQAGTVQVPKWFIGDGVARPWPGWLGAALCVVAFIISMRFVQAQAKHPQDI